MIVTVHTKPECQPCKGTKRKFDQLGIEYTSVELDEASAARFRDEGLGTAPIVEVDLSDGAVWRWAGFQPTQIARLRKLLDGSDPEEFIAA